MFCYKCGKELVDGASFCTSCGTAIVHHHCQKTDQNVKSTPVDLTQNTNSNSENESKKKTKKQKTNLSIRTKNKVSIYIDDENLCKRKPLIYFNNGGWLYSALGNSQSNIHA